MHIRQAAAQTGLSAPRHPLLLEQNGILPPSARTENGYRVYSEEDLEKLGWIASLRELGLPLDSISSLLGRLDNLNLSPSDG